MALRDIIDRSRSKLEELGRQSGIIANHPGHVGDGFILDGKDGRSPHLATIMPEIVSRLEKADDHAIHAMLGHQDSTTELPPHGRDRRNAIRQMTVESFKGHPPADAFLPKGYTRDDLMEIRHSDAVEKEMIRRLADPERVHQIMESGRNLTTSNWNDRRNISNRLVDILQDGPAQDDRIARESQQLGQYDPNTLFDRFRHGPVVRMDQPPVDYKARQSWIGEQLRGETAGIKTGRISIPRAFDIALMERGQIPDHGPRMISLSPPRIGSPEVESALSRQRMAESAPALSDRIIYDRSRNVPGSADVEIPRDPEERRYWTAVALEASYLREVAGLPSANPDKRMTAVSKEQPLARQVEQRSPGHYAQGVAAWRNGSKMDVTL